MRGRRRERRRRPQQPSDPGPLPGHAARLPLHKNRCGVVAARLPGHARQAPQLEGRCRCGRLVEGPAAVLPLRPPGERPTPPPGPRRHVRAHIQLLAGPISHRQLRHRAQSNLRSGTLAAWAGAARRAHPSWPTQYPPPLLTSCRLPLPPAMYHRPSQRLMAELPALRDQLAVAQTADGGPRFTDHASASSGVSLGPCEPGGPRGGGGGGRAGGAPACSPGARGGGGVVGTRGWPRLVWATPPPPLYGQRRRRRWVACCAPTCGPTTALRRRAQRQSQAGSRRAGHAASTGHR